MRQNTPSVAGSLACGRAARFWTNSASKNHRPRVLADAAVLPNRLQARFEVVTPNVHPCVRSR
jgi:hypothetical protein